MQMIYPQIMLNLGRKLTDISHKAKSVVKSNRALELIKCAKNIGLTEDYKYRGLLHTKLVSH